MPSADLRDAAWLAPWPALAVLVVTALAAQPWVRHDAASDPGSRPVVALEARATALGSLRPERPSQSDRIDFLEVRSSTRPDVQWRKQLAEAYAARFGAYGDLTDLDASESITDEIEVERPLDPWVSARSSALHLARHEFRLAVEDARRANRLLADFDSGLRLTLFDALWASGDFVAAEKLLGLQHDESSFGFRTRKARYLDGTGQTEAARDLLIRACSDASAYAESAVVRGWCAVEMGHFEFHTGAPERAVVLYLRALDILPGSPAALEGLAAIAHSVDGNNTAAAALYRRALKSGAHLDVQLALADVLDALGRADDANAERASFRTTVEGGGREMRQYRRPLALLLADHPELPQDRARAIGLAQADLEDRKDPGAWATFAWALHRAGHGSDAVDAAQQALSWGAPSPEVLFKVGTVLAEHGGPDHRAAARHALEAAWDGRFELSLADQDDLAARLAS